MGLKIQMMILKPPFLMGSNEDGSFYTAKQFPMVRVN